MLATNQLTNTNSHLNFDDFDAFLENPLQHKFTIHQSDSIGNVIKELHKNSEGYIASCCLNEDGKFRQKFYKIADFDCETENAFFSVNTFFTTWRNNKCVMEYTCLFSDIDFYNTGLTAQQILWLLEEDVFGITIPYPTWLISSGNGFYYILKFSKNIRVRVENKTNFNLKEKWETCMRFIYDTLKDYGADIKAIDSARILRIDGTYNTKNNTHKKVEIVKNYGNVIDDLDEFVEIWLPESYIQKEKPRMIVKLKAEYSVEEVKITEYANKSVSTKSLKKLNKERMGDIVRLVSMRNGECDGIRNYLLLLYSYHSLLVNGGNLEQTTEETFKLNDMFTHKEKESQIRATLKTAYKAYQEWVSGEKILYNGKWCRKGYNFTNQNLIDTLSITIEEQMKLKTIKSKEVVNEKRNAKKRAKRRNKEGLTKREQQKQETISKIIELKSQGLNNSEIARQLGISRQIVSKYVNQYMKYFF